VFGLVSYGVIMEQLLVLRKEIKYDNAQKACRSTSRK